MAEWRDKKNLNIIYRTEHPDQQDFARWFFQQLGQPGYSIEGELAYRRCMKALVKREPDNEDFKAALRKCEHRIKTMKALLKKGWITPPLKRQPLDNGEQAMLDYLEQVFALQWRERGYGKRENVREQMPAIRANIMETYYD